MVEDPRTTENGKRSPAWRVLAPFQYLRLSWTSLNEWLKALLLAFAVLAFIHVFVLRWVTVRSSSMYSTLREGDLIGVAHWPVWTGFHRGDIAVFHDPLHDDHAMPGRKLLVKRIVGLPGDKVELRDGKLFVNDNRLSEFEGETKSWMVRLKLGTEPSVILHDLGLPPGSVPSEGTMIELPLNKAIAKEILARSDVVSAEPLPGAAGAPAHIFPFSPYFHWNSDDYGPITVPKRGENVRIDATTVPMYDRIIGLYEGNKMENAGNDLLINGVKSDHYTIQQDYYFVLGDSRHYSADSRYWGFVPVDHLVGRASFVLMSSDPEGDVRGDRWFKGLH